MSALTSLALTNVRCFEGRQEARLPRITVLVGENSAGKSTFLGCAHVLTRLVNLQTWNRTLSEWEDLNDENHFDLPPFALGSFSTIARTGATTFALEATFSDHCYERVSVVYDEGPTGEPRERKLSLTLAAETGSGQSFSVARRESPNNDEETWRVTGPGFEFDVRRSSVSYRQFSTWLSRSVRRGNLPHDGEGVLLRKRTSDVTPETARMFSRFVNFFRRKGRFPTCEHLLFAAANDPAGWRRERSYSSNPFGPVDLADLDRIGEMGKELGLFNELDVRRGPVGGYEVRADASGQSLNLTDVGFGVHSALALLQTIASAPEGATLFLQQPEAHLHPQAQAALVELVAARRNRLLVETHSDHVADWLRIAVMSKRVPFEDLGIVYFHRSKDRTSTDLHGIRVDEQANLIDAPAGFRDFFLDETERLLGFRK